LNEREIVCPDLDAALEAWRGDGFRLDSIYPADDPQVAVLEREGERVRLMIRPGVPRPAEALPGFQPRFVLSRAGDPASEGRAGMVYRDLIPGRLGGRYVASLIAIAEGGPVADWVHFHRVALQLIYVRCGWVRVVYEGQGESFVMQPGDLVLQPPQIRHRVLESSAGLEVVEIGCPALHETIADHDLELPGEPDQAREFSGQRFMRHVADRSPWMNFGGGEARETEIRLATGGLAEARAVRGSRIEFPSHDGELVFGFVLEGWARLDRRGKFALASGDAFVIPPDEPWGISGGSEDFQMLHVTTARLG
jgi:quercetin dioxygenase-like cupin family protein